MRRQSYAKLAALALALLVLGACGTEKASSVDKSAPLADLLPAEIRDRGEIVAGALLEVPPIDFRTDSGDLAGVSPDLAKFMGEQLGVDITFRQYGFEGLQPALKAGQIDIIWASMNDTKERQEVLDFIDYLDAGDTLLVPDGNPESVQSLADMCGLPVATVRGATQIERVESASAECEASGDRGIELELFGGASDARLQVKTGRVDAFIGNGPVLRYIANITDDGKTFDAVELEAEKAAYFGIALEKSDEELREALSTALQAVMDSGDYEAVLTEYDLAPLGLEEPLINGAES